MIQASELLLQERMPRDVAVVRPRVEEARASAPVAVTEGPMVRRLTASAVGAPVTHLLSNGRYSVMLTASGSGYSRWRDIAVTRWREDATCDDWGSFVFLRDTQSGAVWSAAAQPVGEQRGIRRNRLRRGSRRIHPPRRRIDDHHGCVLSLRRGRRRGSPHILDQ